MPTPTQKEKIIDRINVTVLGTSKNVLNEFQKKGGYASQSDALTDLLLNYPVLEARIKELEAELAKAKTSK
jgi:hypothetical protein